MAFRWICLEILTGIENGLNFGYYPAVFRSTTSPGSPGHFRVRVFGGLSSFSGFGCAKSSQELSDRRNNSLWHVRGREIQSYVLPDRLLCGRVFPSTRAHL